MLRPVKLFTVLRHVPTADPVTGTPIDSKFTGSDIRTVVAMYRTRAEAEAHAASLAESKPVYVSRFSVNETSV